MLQEVFYWIFNMSITATITGVIIMLVRLIKKVFGGSRKALFSALLEDEPLSEEEINELRKLIDNR